MQNSAENKEKLKELVEMARKEKQEKMIKAIYEGLYELDDESREIILRKVGAVCAQSTRVLREKMGLEYPTGVDLDTACEATTRIACSGPLKRDFTCKRNGDTVEIRDPICDIMGGCSCTLVTSGLIEPHVCLCKSCQGGYWMDHFEYLTGQRPEKIEFPESRTMGHRDCVARCYFKPAE